MSDLNKEQNKEMVFVDLVEELQRNLANPDADYPKDIVERIIEHREYATPKLLEIAGDFLAYSLGDMSSEKWREGAFVFLILGKLREPKAFYLVELLCSMPEKLYEDCLGDFITEHATWLLASTFNDNLKELHDLAVNQRLWEISRWAALDAYVVLYERNIISREQIIEIFSELFDELYDDSSGIPSALVSCCLHIQAIELSEKIERYFTGDRIDLMILDREDVKRSFSRAPGQELKELKARSECYDFVDDIERSSEWLFEKEESSCDSEISEIDNEISNSGEINDPDRVDDDEFRRAACAAYIKYTQERWSKKDLDYASDQVVYTESKIGRNDTCSCGSGKKYKKCCLIN